MDIFRTCYCNFDVCAGVRLILINGNGAAEDFYYSNFVGDAVIEYFFFFVPRGCKRNSTFRRILSRSCRVEFSHWPPVRVRMSCNLVFRKTLGVFLRKFTRDVEIILIVKKELDLL